MTDDLIAAQYAQGKILIRSRNDWNVTGAGDLARGGEVVEYMFVNPKNLRGLPQQVIQYKIGYVPKINEGIEFVVKRRMPVEKMGVVGSLDNGTLGALKHIGLISQEEADRSAWKIKLIEPMVTRRVINMIKGTIKYTSDDWSAETWQDMGMDDKADGDNYDVLFLNWLREQGYIT